MVLAQYSPVDSKPPSSSVMGVLNKILGGFAISSGGSSDQDREEPSLHVTGGFNLWPGEVFR